MLHMATKPTLWNKARRDSYAIASTAFTGMQPSPGGTWPTLKIIAKCILQLAIASRRPCCTWQPGRCFGTKRGVIRMPSQAQHSPACNHRQVEPGLAYA
ncbi:DUF1589 domain-containing protein [Rhodopirellula baltica]